MSDRPGAISDFETLVVRITKIHPKPADASRETFDIDDTEGDLVDLQGGESASIGTVDLETGQYEFLQLTVGKVVEAVLKAGGDATVTTPGDAPLKFEKAFDIRAGETTTFVADFTPVKQGGQTATFASLLPTRFASYTRAKRRLHSRVYSVRGPRIDGRS